MPGRSLGAKWNSASMRGTPVSPSNTSALAVSVTTYCAALKRSLSGALRWIRSAAKLAQIRATIAQAGPATSSAAKAKVVEVVTSPSAPRVTTLREISSPANAQTANSMTSAVNSLSRLLPSLTKTNAQQSAPRMMTPVT
jgi:hypothetical protein